MIGIRLHCNLKSALTYSAQSECVAWERVPVLPGGPALSLASLATYLNLTAMVRGRLCHVPLVELTLELLTCLCTARRLTHWLCRVLEASEKIQSARTLHALVFSQSTLRREH